MTGPLRVESNWYQFPSPRASNAELWLSLLLAWTSCSTHSRVGCGGFVTNWESLSTSWRRYDWDVNRTNAPSDLHFQCHDGWPPCIASETFMQTVPWTSISLGSHGHILMIADPHLKAWWKLSACFRIQVPRTISFLTKIVLFTKFSLCYWGVFKWTVYSLRDWWFVKWKDDLTNWFISAYQLSNNNRTNYIIRIIYKIRTKCYQLL